MLQDNWYRCYGKSWKGALSDASFCHPAKVSRALAQRIYNHAIEEGWLKPKDSVLDPFAGICGFAFDAMRLGLHYTGIELESRFVDLGQQNIALWNSQFRGMLPNWGTAILLQGDSRRLGEVVRESVQAAVSSPPFASCLPQNEKSMLAPHQQVKYGRNEFAPSVQARTYGECDGQLGAMGAGDFDACVSSPPWADSLDRGNVDPAERRRIAREQGISNTEYISPIDMENVGLRTQPDYGESDGQLGVMMTGDFDACVSSPPFENTAGSDDPDKRGGLFRDPKRRGDVNLTGTYGESEGQLGAMIGGFDAAVSSPPFEATGVGGSNNVVNLNRQCVSHNRPDTIAPGEDARGLTYGNTDGQLGTEQPDTFWSAACAIVEQVYSLLVPGGVAIWVVKDFIRGGERVLFSQQWAALNEACGFEWLHEHRAMLIEDHGAQYDLFGELHEKQVKRSSFFRRLYESKYPENSIDWESVLCMRKPKG
jgi:hypothetical protein